MLLTAELWRFHQDAAKGGVWSRGGVSPHQNRQNHQKTVKTVNGLEVRVASPVFPGPMSAVIPAGKKPPELPKPSKPPKPSNAAHPLDHTPPLQHLDSRPAILESRNSQVITPAQHVNFGHSHFSRKIPPKHQNGVPKMNIPEFPGPRVSVECNRKPGKRRASMYQLDLQ